MSSALKQFQVKSLVMSEFYRHDTGAEHGTACTVLLQRMLLWERGEEEQARRRRRRRNRRGVLLRREHHIRNGV